jgi:hypothetical protein
LAGYHYRQAHGRIFRVPNAALAANVRNETMINDKQSCIDNLCGSLNRSAIWRRGLEAKWPDPRNGKAAIVLDSLADETNDLSEEDWKRLKPYYRWDSTTFADALSLASRHVAFKSRVKTLPAFVNHFVGILAEQHVAN